MLSCSMQAALHHTWVKRVHTCMDVGNRFVRLKGDLPDRIRMTSHHQRQSNQLILKRTMTKQQHFVVIMMTITRMGVGEHQHPRL